jgi:hypothetical protein
VPFRAVLRHGCYSMVTDLARFLGWSTSQPRPHGNVIGQPWQWDDFQNASEYARAQIQRLKDAGICNVVLS